MDAATTTDAFLGGRVLLRQPRSGYRAGVDAVLLAAAVPARAGETVLELGCGAGAVALCLAARVPGVRLTGVEVQAAYAELARANAAAAGVAMAVVTADLRALPAAVAGQGFDHVVANPPYFPAPAQPAAGDPGRATARAEGAALADWVETGVRRLVPGGRLTLIQRAARLPELLAALDARMGAVEVLPLAARAGRAPEHVILRALKGRRTPFRLLAPLVLHAGARHAGDGEDYAPQVADVLRNAAPLPGFLQP